MEDAHAKADGIAQTAQVVLGKVYSITQTSLTMPTNRQGIGYAAASALSGANTQVPIATGENEVVAQVEVVYFVK